jgi:hypothetical protein
LSYSFETRSKVTEAITAEHRAPVGFPCKGFRHWPRLAAGLNNPPPK